MISLERAKTLLVEQAGGAATSRVLVDAISTGTAVPISSSPGGGTARTLARDFGIRKASTERGGHEAVGLDEVLQALHASPGASITLLHFRGQDEVFSLFIRDADECVLGVVRLAVPPEE